MDKKNKKQNYWLFQVNPAKFKLKTALRYNALETFPVKAHLQRIKKGDKFILWQTGPGAGLYGLGDIISDPSDIKPSNDELSYYADKPEEGPRVKIEVQYNLWNAPLQEDALPKGKAFINFHAGSAGSNFRATKAQFQALEKLIRQMDVIHEPETEYQVKKWLNPPANLILYGPPGTGKTYQTINYALSIIENRPLSELALEDRSALRNRFGHYLNAGRIAFITFHQSFSYEDFVEGIKPVTINKQISYQVEDGIFKILSLDARRCLLEAYLREQPNQGMELNFNQLYSAFVEYLQQDDFHFFITEKNHRVFLHRILRFGNLSLRRAKSYSVQTVEKNNLKKLYQLTHQPETQPPGTSVKQLVGGGDASLYKAVLKELEKFEGAFLQALENEQTVPGNIHTYEVPVISESILAKCNKYVLIIDEINRGNISSIFGDLITLIEADKREGREEALSAVLPYSKTYFSVPPNLYLIGTMNATDLSIEGLDTALRRRFSFKQIVPDPKVISSTAESPVAAGVDLEKLLKAINNRLELLLDRDHLIGHAYFLKVSSLDDLKKLFGTKIIPLLQEYFFNDFGKIGLVLGKDFVRQVDEENSFADFDYPYASEFSDKVRYELEAVDKLDEAAFIRIYDPEYR